MAFLMDVSASDERPSGVLERPQSQVAATSVGTDLDGLPNLCDGTISILQGGHRPTHHDARFDVVRLRFKEPCHPVPGILELPGGEQQGSRLHLCVSIVR